MSSSNEFVMYASEQMRLGGKITSKKMFGDYAVYCDGKCFGLICDNQLFITPTKAGMDFLKAPRMGIPYSGAKQRILIENLEDTEMLGHLIKITCEQLPVKKKAIKKSKDKKLEK